LLQLDIKEAFDAVHHQWLKAIMRKAGYPDWCQRWMRSYLADRTAYFVFDSQKSSNFKTIAGVPQGFLLLPVLFLLYIATLYENLQAAHPQLIIVGFADNTNLLAISGTFEANKDLLKAAWKTCEKWFQKTGIEFASEKSELLHFSKARAACELFYAWK
jgi:hypothetical protein